jgi:hypothetical protein
MNKRINYWGRLCLAFIVFLISCHNNGKEQCFSLRTLTPFVIKKNGAEIFQYWEFKNDPLLWDINIGQLPALQSYKDSLENILGKNTFKLTIQQVAFQDISYKLINTENGDSINAQLIHSNTLGKIRPINLLEAQLLDYQLSRYPLLSHPTEFHGFILLNDSLNRVRVYFAASDQPWPPKPKVILDAVKNDLNQGWTLNYHLHNHYEPKSNHYVGILAPSLADAQYYMFLSEDYNLGHALITNGFYTVEIQRGEFQKFKSHNNN